MLVRQNVPTNDGFTRFDFIPAGGVQPDYAYHLRALECVVRGSSQANIEVGCVMDDKIIDGDELILSNANALTMWAYPQSGIREFVEYDQVITFRDKFPFYTLIESAEPSQRLQLTLYYEYVKLTDIQVIALNRRQGISRFSEIFE